MSRVVQRTLGKYAALSVGVDQWEPGSFPRCRPGCKPGILEVCIWTSRGMKVNEFANLTTSEFVSEYTEEKPNTVWSGRKHLEPHEYINEPLDQMKPDSCFQSSDEGPSLLFFVCRLESELNCR